MMRKIIRCLISLGLVTGISVTSVPIGLSYKATNYAHNKYTNTYITPIKKYVYRSDYTWYPNKNYKGSTYKQTLYYMKEIG